MPLQSHVIPETDNRGFFHAHCSAQCLPPWCSLGDALAKPDLGLLKAGSCGLPLADRAVDLFDVGAAIVSRVPVRHQVAPPTWPLTRLSSINRQPVTPTAEDVSASRLKVQSNRSCHQMGVNTNCLAAQH
ncbi:hypothetical protein CA85_10680 [Allorhodopirellula solitaria]|uniref:Uncharacterized protein n=1 Tax=Allorhodopirellula solitaria TaxID=2527987 RepID=A0A5C5YHH2_9BACT|nr:hypothetical protein CA85_10680 [Allorhodopirellula solitaria]